MKQIAVVTGTRAEYGLLKPLIKAIDSDKDLELQLLVTGMHLSDAYGSTYKEIEADGFVITERIDCELGEDTSEAISKSIGKGIDGFSKVYHTLDPDIIIVLGDRTEILAAAVAAMVKGIPLAHIHGGETTEGAYDESIRHAITKMSYLHFTSTETYRKRVIQLGEHPSRVFNVGAIGIDSIKTLPLLDKSEFEKSISFPLNKKNVLITFHPVTLETDTAENQFKALLKAIDKLEDATLIFTKPNSDKGGKVIVEMIDDYVEKNNEKAVAFVSLGQLRYLSALQYVDVVVGNSSSGILEVPIFNKPTINIGDRQKGRLMPNSVICCGTKYHDIDKALTIALGNEFKDMIKTQKNLYGDGMTTQKILTILKQSNIGNLKKSFYDLTFEHNG